MSIPTTERPSAPPRPLPCGLLRISRAILQDAAADSRSRPRAADDRGRRRRGRAPPRGRRGRSSGSCQPAAPDAGGGHAGPADRDGPRHRGARGTVLAETLGSAPARSRSPVGPDAGRCPPGRRCCSAARRERSGTRYGSGAFPGARCRLRAPSGRDRAHGALRLGAGLVARRAACSPRTRPAPTCTS